MKRQIFLVFALTLLLGLTAVSCKKDEDPLLVTDMDESFSYDEWEIETKYPGTEGIIPADNYLSRDYDVRCDTYVCESEKRIYCIINPKHY